MHRREVAADELGAALVAPRLAADGTPVRLSVTRAQPATWQTSMASSGAVGLPVLARCAVTARRLAHTHGTATRGALPG